MIQLTAAGRELLLRALSNTATINFLDVQFGNGSNAGTSASALNNPLLTIGISHMTIDNPFVTLYTVFQNNTLASGFRRTETGVRAEDPDHPGTALLFAYGYTAPESAEYIPADSEDGIESLYNIEVYIGDAENVTASISESVIYATKDELEALQSEVENVSKDSIGLGNVPNVSTNDQTPTYSEAEELTGLTSGEKLSVAFGKIKKAISALIAHISSTGNVHQAQPSDIGAAAASHRHSTSDITSGVLGVARGGTGNTDGTASKATKLATARTLKVNLESTSGASFDGSGNASIGVGGILPVSQGGTGSNSLAGAATSLGVVPKTRKINSQTLEQDITIKGDRSARFIVGTSASGWTEDDCDYLCDGTDDQAEINAALSAVRSGGGKVILLDGVYKCSANVTISKAGTELEGTGGAEIEFTLEDKRLYCAQNKCTIRNLSIKGQSEGAPGWFYDPEETLHPTVYINGASRVLLQGLRLKTGEIYLKDCSNCIVTGCFSGESNGYIDAIELSGGNSNTVTGCNFTGGFYAIFLKNEKRLTFMGNVCTLYNEYGLYATGLVGATITGNVIDSASGGDTYGVYFTDCRNLTLHGNYFGNKDGANGQAFALQNCTYFIVTGNTIVTDYNNYPLKLTSCNDGYCEHNILAGTSSITTGYSANGCTNVIVADNIVHVYDASAD